MKKIKLIGITMILSLVVTLNFGNQLNQPSKLVYSEIKVAGDDIPVYIGMSIPIPKGLD